MPETRNEWLARMTETHGIDAEDILEIAELFFETVGDNVEEIKEAHDSGDSETVVRLAHGLKGAAANIGFEEISEKAKVLEKQGNENMIENLSLQLKSIFELIEVQKQRFGMD